MGKFKRKKSLKKTQVNIKSKPIELADDKAKYNEVSGLNCIIPTAYWKFDEERLFYNEKTMKQVSELSDLLDRQTFRRIEKRALSKRPNLPFVVLLHGPSGTGKTALVREICRRTKRHLFEVRAEKLRNENCGQDEKALTVLFEDYMYSVSVLEEYPILFFDECEAHLCRRMNLDSFNPTMINHLNNVVGLWLKEFQKFHGILFLATNRKDDLDDAFARRILYQIEVDHPTKEIQAEIWEYLFPNVLNPEQCRRLAEETNFTGGQIKQVQTKADLHEILYGKMDYNTIRKVCETNGNTSTERKRIGFSL